MADTISAAEEAELLAATKQASALVDGGLEPDAAIEKVARDRGFGPGKIRLVATAYNTGRQLAQWRGEGSILDKLASFPLSDPENVIASIYGEKKAADSVHADYYAPPRWLPKPSIKSAVLEKAASATLTDATPHPRDPLFELHKGYGQIQRAKQAADEASRQASAAMDAVRGSVARLVGYFKQAAAARLPFDRVEYASRCYFGEQAGPLMDVVYQQAYLREKRASVEHKVLTTAVNLRAEPFTLIHAAIKAASECHRLRQLASKTTAEIGAVKEAALRPFFPVAPLPSQPPAPRSSLAVPSNDLSSVKAAAVFGTEKSAFGFGSEVAAIATGDILAHRATHGNEDEDPYGDAEEIDEETDMIRRLANTRNKSAFVGGATISGMVGGAMGRTMGTMPQTKDDLVENAWMDLEDPEHANELRRIRHHAMLSAMLSDPEDPISGHDPDKVLKAFNEISAATPRLAENAATLRPVLRRRLEGHQEPFEAKELLDIEKGIAQSRTSTPNTSILSESPEKLLG